MVDGFRPKAGGVHQGCQSTGQLRRKLDFSMHGGSSVRAGGMLEFLQGLSEIAGHRDIACTAAVVPCDGEAAV